MVRSLAYCLEDDCPVQWNAQSEQGLHADFPFGKEVEIDASFVIRRYLETLWLPEVSDYQYLKPISDG